MNTLIERTLQRRAGFVLNTIKWLVSYRHGELVRGGVAVGRHGFGEFFH